TEAALVALEIRQPDSTPTADSLLHKALAADSVQIATLTGHTAEVVAASFSPDGTRVVTASKDKPARIWNATTGQTIACLMGHTGEAGAASFCPDGSRLVTGSAH